MIKLFRLHLAAVIVGLLIGGVFLVSSPVRVQAQAGSGVFCRGVAEIALVLDGSGSIAQVQTAIRQFAELFTASFSVSDAEVRFTIVGFSNGVTLNQPLAGSQAVGAFFAGNQTNIAIGMTTALNNLAAARPGVPRAMVVLTDGGHNVTPTIDVTNAAQAVRGAGIALFAVGYQTTNTDTTVLNAIESGAGSAVVTPQQLAARVAAIVQTVCTPIGGTFTTTAASACIDIPAGSVVGELLTTSNIYWAPGKVSPGLSLQPTPDNKTYWVLGVDETGEYYKIILACQYIWVPVGVMAPAFSDPVWQGTPLPTRIVE